MIAVPSILIVAPRGTVKEPIEDLTPRLFLTVSSVTGIVALLDEVLKAKTASDLTFIKNLIGLSLAKRVKRLPYVIKA
jgi:hypothetical protein